MEAVWLVSTVCHDGYDQDGRFVEQFVPMVGCYLIVPGRGIVATVSEFCLN